MTIIDQLYWQGRRVFLTGHTGFKGSWLAFWLLQMGAKVYGYSLEPNTNPSMFNYLELEKLMEHQIGDIRNKDDLAKAIKGFDPEVVLHLAAQPIVSKGYTEPIATFETNIMGVVNLLESCRFLTGPIPILIVSSDKCYLNNDCGKAFEINDPLGGHDPYSASKAGTEIVTASYRSSFFATNSAPRIASARAGNVVGGGDWSHDRLLPDCARAFNANKPIFLRNPSATRPWQHVLEPLFGYLVLIQELAKKTNFARPWNFGPIDRNHQPVHLVAETFKKAWGDNAIIENSYKKQAWKEATTLDLNCAETSKLLGYKPVLNIDETINITAEWYRSVYSDPSVNNVRRITNKQIEFYENCQNRCKL